MKNIKNFWIKQIELGDVEQGDDIEDVLTNEFDIKLYIVNYLVELSLLDDHVGGCFPNDGDEFKELIKKGICDDPGDYYEDGEGLDLKQGVHIKFTGEYDITPFSDTRYQVIANGIKTNIILPYDFDSYDSFVDMEQFKKESSEVLKALI